MKMKLYTIKALSGLHCGVGQGLNDIDLPTAKESVTGFPYVPGSSIKGVLRDHFGRRNDPMFEAAFGQEALSGDMDFASAVSFSDARLVCLPARSYFGTFAWLTSPYTLSLMQGMLKRAGAGEIPALPEIPADADSSHVVLPPESNLVSKNLGDRVLLEDLDLLLDKNEKNRKTALEWATLLGKIIFPEDDANDKNGRDIFAGRFAVADDNILSFLCETALPVAARIRIGENGVVEQGALWYEEYVPAETLFLGAVFSDHGKGRHSGCSATDLLDYVTGSTIDCQIGGKATIGRGMVTINFA